MKIGSASKYPMNEKIARRKHTIVMMARLRGGFVVVFAVASDCFGLPTLLFEVVFEDDAVEAFLFLVDCAIVHLDGKFSIGCAMRTRTLQIYK